MKVQISSLMSINVCSGIHWAFGNGGRLIIYGFNPTGLI